MTSCDRIGEIGGELDSPAALVAALRPGETGCLRTGTYSDRQVSIRTAGVTVRSYPGDRARWRGRIVLAAPGITVADLTLDGASGPPCGSGCPPGTVLPSPTITSPNGAVVGNDIRNARGICVHALPYAGSVPDRFRIEGNRIHGCRPSVNKIHGVYIAGGRGGVVRSNVIYANGDRGVQLFPAARDTLVEQNTIDGNGEGVLIGGDQQSASSGNRIERNVISESRVRWNVESFWPGPVGEGNSVTGNCLHALAGRPRYAARGGVAEPRGFAASDNVIARPGYRDRANGDFALREGSECAGLGAPRQVATPCAAAPEPSPRPEWLTRLPRSDCAAAP